MNVAPSLKNSYSCRLCFCVLLFYFADVAILASKVFMSLQEVNESRDHRIMIDRLEHSYVSAAMRQLVCLLGLYPKHVRCALQVLSKA